MSFYVFRQNNSGGYFNGPAVNVWVEASSPEEANDVAQNHGVYFDGEGDCSCCGNRWRQAYEYDAYDEPLCLMDDWAEDVESVYSSLVVFRDGNTRKVLGHA